MLHSFIYKVVYLIYLNHMKSSLILFTLLTLTLITTHQTTLKQIHKLTPRYN